MPAVLCSTVLYSHRTALPERASTDSVRQSDAASSPWSKRSLSDKVPACVPAAVLRFQASAVSLLFVRSGVRWPGDGRRLQGGGRGVRVVVECIPHTEWETTRAIFQLYCRSPFWQCSMAGWEFTSQCDQIKKNTWKAPLMGKIITSSNQK